MLFVWCHPSDRGPRRSLRQRAELPRGCWQNGHTDRRTDRRTGSRVWACRAWAAVAQTFWDSWWDRGVPGIDPGCSVSEGLRCSRGCTNPAQGSGSPQLSPAAGHGVSAPASCWGTPQIPLDTTVSCKQEPEQPSLRSSPFTQHQHCAPLANTFHLFSQHGWNRNVH